MVENSLAPPTRFDLNFRLGDIPVRVHPLFWISALFLGVDTKLGGFDLLSHLFVWAAILFVSILVHELGHILMGRWFGSRGHILLTGLCGLAIGSGDQPRRWQRIAVLLAGPGAGFLFGSLVIAAASVQYPHTTIGHLSFLCGMEYEAFDMKPPPPLLSFAILNLIAVNLLWGLVNLLPIWPLDGGQICREICEQHRGREGLGLSLAISFATALGLALVALGQWLPKTPLLPWLPFGGTLLPVVFFAVFALGSWQMLQLVRRVGPDWESAGEEPLEPWQQDADWWKRGDSPWRD